MAMNKFVRFFQRTAALPTARLLLVSGSVLSLAIPANAQQAVQDLVSIPRRGDQLIKLDRRTGETISTVTINVPGSANCNLRGGSGLAKNPLTEELFALLNCGPGGPRLLAIIGELSGNATIIGDTGDNFAGLAFGVDGKLFGVTGNGADTPNTLFTLDTSNATAAPVCQLPSQPPEGGGQTIAFDPVEGLLFHASGNESQGGTRIFESIDDVTPTDPLASCPVMPRNLTGDDYGEATAMVFNGSFLLADLGGGQQSNLYNVTNDGVVEQLGVMDHVSRGLAFVSGPARICYKVKKDPADGGNESVEILDAVVGPRSAILKTKKAFTLCLPGGIRFTVFTSITPPGGVAQETEQDSVVEGEICYKVKKDDSGAARRTDLEVEDEANGKRIVKIKTGKAFEVCDRALINVNALQ